MAIMARWAALDETRAGGAQAVDDDLGGLARLGILGGALVAVVIVAGHA